MSSSDNDYVAARALLKFRELRDLLSADTSRVIHSRDLETLALILYNCAEMLRHHAHTFDELATRCHRSGNAPPRAMSDVPTVIDTFPPCSADQHDAVTYRPADDTGVRPKTPKPERK